MEGRQSEGESKKEKSFFHSYKRIPYPPNVVGSLDVDRVSTVRDATGRRKSHAFWAALRYYFSRMACCTPAVLTHCSVVCKTEPLFQTASARMYSSSPKWMSTSRPSKFGRLVMKMHRASAKHLYIYKCLTHLYFGGTTPGLDSTRLIRSHM